jgi:hypothetical protein
MSTATVNIECYVGDDVARTITFVGSDRTTPVNITGRTYTAQFFTADGSVAGSFTASVPTGTDGKVTLSLGHATTTSLGAGAWRWSLVESASGVISTLLVGTFAISSEV